MGHQRIGTLPDTAPWRRVVGCLADAADVGAVAAATTEAARRGLEQARDDEGLAYSFWLLSQVVRAARQDDFAAALRDAGLVVSDQPDLFDIAAAFSDAVDRHLAKTRGRTDLGEMAELEAVKSLCSLLDQRAARLYGSTAAEIHQAVRELSTARGFASLAHEFFADFTQQFLGYHLGRELSLHVGGNGRFLDPDEHNQFVAQLETHCREVAAIMRDFAADWYSKATSPRGKGGTLASAKGFVNRTLEKLEGEMRIRGERDVQ
jgi:hypothetical protein